MARSYLASKASAGHFGHKLVTRLDEGVPPPRRSRQARATGAIRAEGPAIEAWKRSPARNPWGWDRGVSGGRANGLTLRPVALHLLRGRGVGPAPGARSGGHARTRDRR